MCVAEPQHGLGIANASAASTVASAALGPWRDAQQLAHPGEVLGLHAARQQAVVADAVEALGQHVQKEAADEMWVR